MLQMCGKVIGGPSMLSEVLVRTAPESDGDVCFEHPLRIGIAGCHPIWGRVQLGVVDSLRQRNERLSAQ